MLYGNTNSIICGWKKTPKENGTTPHSMIVPGTTCVTFFLCCERIPRAMHLVVASETGVLGLVMEWMDGRSFVPQQQQEQQHRWMR